MQVRKATPADALPLARLAERTFRDAFGAMNTPEDMDHHCRASYGEALQAAEIADPARLTLLACEAEQTAGGAVIAGYAQLRWGPAPACVQARAPGEVQRIYVDARWHGRGVAQALMAACLRELQARGADVAWLGVWERNPRAIAFYRKLGFVERGEHVFQVGSDPQRDVVMARPFEAA